LSKPRREPNWKPATLSEVARIAIIQKFFDTVLEEPVRAPVSVGGDAVPRDSAEWAEYEARRKADQMDLPLARADGSAASGGGGRDSGSGRKKGGGVGVVGGFERQQQQQQQQQDHHHEEEGKTNYGLPTEEEIRAVLLRGRASGKAGMGVVGMTRKQLEMGLKGNRPAMKLGVEERLDEVIGRKELGVEGSDRLVWRDE
jgi:hypothetical protein